MSDAATIYAFRRNLVLAASAGTGKTHSLVGVVVHLLLGASELGGRRFGAPVSPSRVVATTFSRKAAAEIRARLVEELERLASADPRAKYRRDLAEACARAGAPAWSDAEVAARARRALDGLPQAQIGTLHGFASSLVKAHAFEVGLSPGFELMDEEASRARVDEAIARVLEARAASGDAELRDLVHVAGGVDRLVQQIAQTLARLEEDGRGAAALAVDEEDARVAEALYAQLVDHARAVLVEPKLADAAKALLAAHAAKDVAAIAEGARALCGASKAGKKGPAAEAFFAFRDALPGDTNADRGARLVRRWKLRHRFAEAARAARDLLVACEAEIRRANAAESTLAFGDVLRAARDLLRDHPDVAAEIADEIDVLLVDEFQDTSRLQRDLVQLLWAKDPRARAAGEVPHIGALRGHGLFVVGDRKQSIYGFRGADVGVFAEFCVGLAGAPARKALGIAPGVTWEPEQPTADFVPLQHNRRGHDELLAFANALSAARFQPGDGPAQLYEIAYVPTTEDLLPPPERARPAEPIARTQWLRVPPRGARASDAIDEACVIAEAVQRILAGDGPTIDGAAPSPRDVAVLAETNRMLDATAFALARAGVPYVVAGNGFYGAREVRDLAAMLALLLDGGDALAILEVLRGPWAGVRDETLLALTDPHRGLVDVSRWGDEPRLARLHDDDRARVDEVRRVVEALRGSLDRLGPGGALREAVRALALEEALVQLPRGPQRVANVRKLLAIADAAPSARVLLDRLDDAAAREAAETEAATFSEEDDAVRLLTVHASKGLDFPIVFVPQVGSDARAIERGAIVIGFGVGDEPNVLSARVLDDAGAAVDGASYERACATARRRDRAERQRLTYVAVTRASHAMRMVGDRAVPQKGETQSYAATTAAALRAIADDDHRRARAMLEVIDVTPRVPQRDLAAAPAARATEPRFDAAPLAPRWRSLPIATTALQDFDHCARRFELAHLLDLPEEAPPFVAGVPREEPTSASAPRLDARAEGTLAHRVLEHVPAPAFGRDEARAEAAAILAREGIGPEHEKHAVVLDRVLGFLQGGYAARVAAARAALLREHPFVLEVPDAAGRALVLRGTIDLLVRWPDGGVDVLDYKRARGPSAERYAFQLDAYALAARALFPGGAPRVRAGIVFLGGDASEPIWRASLDVEAARARLAALGSRLVEARWSERFPRVEVAACRAIRCGYVALCHPEER